MPYIDPGVILEAKRMDLLTYLQNYEPQELVHVNGSTYSTRSHDSLKISNGKWCWWSQGIGGRSALDYLIKVNGLSFMDAVTQIVGQAAMQPPVLTSTEKHTPKTLILPEPSTSTDEVEKYLLNRGIDSELINFCISSGRIYESHNYVETSGKTFINAVFVGFDMEGNRKYAALRGIRGNFKGEATGSDKRYSFALPAQTSADTVHLFESGIDLLSYASILNLMGKDYQKEHLLSLAGVYQPKKQIEDSKVPAALTQFLQDYPEIKKVELHLDNDRAGRMATHAIMTVLPKQYERTKASPPCGKDFNDCLLEYRGFSRKYNERMDAR